MKADAVKAEGLGPGPDPDLEPRLGRADLPALHLVAADRAAPTTGACPRTRRAAGASSRAAPEPARRDGVRDDGFCRRSRAGPIAGRRRPTTCRRCCGFFEAARADGGFDDGIRAALERLLVSPDFLFRIEADPRAVAPGSRRTASRTSSWRRACRSSCGAASRTTSCSTWPSRAQLRQPAVLDRQVRRMLADPRARAALVEQFLRPVAADAQRVAADARRQHEVPVVRRQPARRVRARNRALPRRSAEGRPQHRRSAGGRLHVPQRAARRATTGFAASTAATSGACRWRTRTAGACSARPACWPSRRIPPARRRRFAASGCSTTSSPRRCRRRPPT